MVECGSGTCGGSPHINACAAATSGVSVADEADSRRDRHPRGQLADRGRSAECCANVDPGVQPLVKSIVDHAATSASQALAAPAEKHARDDVFARVESWLDLDLDNLLELPFDDESDESDEGKSLWWLLFEHE
jgi:hypothetical protein